MTTLATVPPSPSGSAAALPGAGSLGWEAAVAAPLGVRSAGDLYRAEGLLGAERRQVLGQAWSLVATSAEVPPGHYVTADPGGYPIVVVRDGAGGLRAFHNLCRHRGMPLLRGRGEAGRYLTCPYHQWSFGRDGALVRVPQSDEQFADLDPAAWGLLPAAVAEWHGMILVHPGEAPPPVDEAVGPLEDRLSSWWAAPLEEVAVVRYEVAANWKLLVENHLDVYHLWYLHQRSLGAYEHRSFRWAWEGDTWWSYEPLKPGETVPSGLPGLAAEERAGIGAHLLFPNLMLVTTAEYLATYDAVAVAVDRTALTLRVRSAPGADADALVGAIRSFLAEDIVACEALQAATASPRFAVGPLAADHEEPVRRFHARLRRGLSGGGT